MAKLFMLLLGATPPGRHTEQHDVFFGIADSIRQVLPQVKAFWPEAGKGLHIDAWREVCHVDGCRVTVLDEPGYQSIRKLFFINLGGYKPGAFEEFHYRMIIAAFDAGEAVRIAKRNAFFRHTGFKGAAAHIDDKYGIDVDEVYAIHDILPPVVKQRYSLKIDVADTRQPEDEMHLGYFRLSAVSKWAPE
jgi:hypothetical protein